MSDTNPKTNRPETALEVETLLESVRELHRTVKAALASAQHAATVEAGSTGATEADRYTAHGIIALQHHANGRTLPPA